MTLTSPSTEQELTRIRAMLLPVVTPTQEEEAEIESGKRELIKGHRVPLQEVLDELS